MKKYALLILVLASCSSTQQTSITPYFSPPGPPLENIVVAAIDSAHSQILVQAFDLNSDAICAALKRAYRNHVRVKVLVDKRNETENNSCIDEPGWRIPTRIDDEGGYAHNKIMIIDSSIVITGSYNFTEHAKKNEENLLVIHDSSIARQYIENWWARRIESRKTD